MGKNPNAKKLKEKKHRDREYGTNIDDLEEEASRRGITVLELERIKKDLEGSDSDEDSDDSQDNQQTKKV